VRLGNLMLEGIGVIMSHFGAPFFYIGLIGCSKDKFSGWSQMVPHRGSAEKPISSDDCWHSYVESQLDECVIGSCVAKVGDEPASQIASKKLKVTMVFRLLDTPGILWPKYENPAAVTFSGDWAGRDTADRLLNVALVGLKFFIARLSRPRLLLLIAERACAAPYWCF